MKKIIFILLIVAFPSLSIARDIKIAFSHDSTSAVLLFGIRDKFSSIANEMGIKNVSLDYTHVQSSTYSWPLFLKNEIDMHMTAISSFANYNEKKPNHVKVLFAINSTEQQLLCHPSISSIDDLKNNKPVVAVAGKNQGGHLALSQLANQYFGDSKYFEEKLVVPSTKQLLQVVASGSNEIGCAIWGSPVQGEIKNVYGWNKIATSDIKLINVFVVKKEWAENNAQLVEALIKTYKHVASDFYENPKYYVELYTKYSGIKESVDRLTQNYIDDGYKTYSKIDDDLDNYLTGAVNIKFIESKSYEKIEEIFWNFSNFK